MLKRGVVVMALHDKSLLDLTSHPLLETRDHPAHHSLAVEQRELLSLAQVRDVVPEFLLVLREIREVPVRERLALAQFLCNADVLLRELVPDPTGTRMKEQPYPVLLIAGQFDEMIPAAQGCELETPVSCNFLRVSNPRIGFQLRDQIADVPASMCVVVPGGKRNRFLNGFPQGCQGVLPLIRVL